MYRRAKKVCKLGKRSVSDCPHTKKNHDNYNRRVNLCQITAFASIKNVFVLYMQMIKNLTYRSDIKS